MQPARAKAELMLLKPQDVKGDKAHLRVKVREKVKFAKSLLPGGALFPVQRAGGKQSLWCRNFAGLSSDTSLLELPVGGLPARAPAAHLLFPDQRGNSEQVLEVWTPAEPTSQAQHFAKWHPKEITWHLLVYNYWSARAPPSMAGFWQRNEISCILELLILCPNTSQHELWRSYSTAQPSHPPLLKNTVCSSSAGAVVWDFRHLA